MRKIHSVWCLCFALSVLIGCGKQETKGNPGIVKATQFEGPFGEIRGKVFVNHIPVTVGTVWVQSIDGQRMRQSEIDGGEYTISQAPTGEVKIFLQFEQVEGPVAAPVASVDPNLPPQPQLPEPPTPTMTVPPHLQLMAETVKRIPKEYRFFHTTPLSTNILPDQKIDFNIVVQTR